VFKVPLLVGDCMNLKPRFSPVGEAPDCAVAGTLAKPTTGSKATKRVASTFLDEKLSAVMVLL
jgi:hypothetical protein